LSFQLSEYLILVDEGDWLGHPLKDAIRNRNSAPFDAYILHRLRIAEVRQHAPMSHTASGTERNPKAKGRVREIKGTK